MGELVLVEHVATSADRFRPLEGSVDNLETSVAEITTSIGVREGIEIYKTDNAASRKQREFVASRSPRRRSCASTAPSRPTAC